MRTLILASNSPRRSELLKLIAVPYTVNPADIDEGQLAGESPVEFVRRLACQKAMIVAEEQSGLVIAADTIVVDGEELLGKPVDPTDARRMLEKLRARTHQVYTGIAIVDSHSGQTHVNVCQTDVPMRDYSTDEIEAYIATGDPLDKAGAYGIQNPHFHPVEGLHGCYASVMGLPLCHLLVGLRMFIQPLINDLPERCQAYLNYLCPVYASILDQP